MKKFRKNQTKENFFRAIHKERLNYISILPSLITIINALCGFTSIVLASNGKFAFSAYMLLLAMVADMLDGRVARMSKSTSSFGGQLDSLCDMISFGLAPAFLMLKVTQYKFTSIIDLSVNLEGFLNRFVWLAAAAYISCAAIRLARFNVENEEDESAHMSFVGLPSPAAAGVVVSLVLFHQEILQDMSIKSSSLVRIGDDLLIFSLPLIVLSVGILMVSRIRYPHIVNQYFKGKKPFAYFIKALVAIAFMMWSHQVTLILVFCGFAVSGLVKWLYTRFGKKTVPTDESAQDSDSAE